MYFNDLIEKIRKSGAATIEVRQLAAKHGNEGGEGDYDIVELDLNGEVIRLTNQTGTWS